MAQAASSPETTQKLFYELKSKTEEARIRAADELYENVVTVSRGIFPFRFP